MDDPDVDKHFTQLVYARAQNDCRTDEIERELTSGSEMDPGSA